MFRKCFFPVGNVFQIIECLGNIFPSWQCFSEYWMFRKFFFPVGNVLRVHQNIECWAKMWPPPTCKGPTKLLAYEWKPYNGPMDNTETTGQNGTMFGMVGAFLDLSFKQESINAVAQIWLLHWNSSFRIFTLQNLQLRIFLQQFRVSREMCDQRRKGG